MQKREMNAELAPQPASSYSQAVEVTDAARILFISGSSVLRRTEQHPSGMAEQARLPWRNSGVKILA